MPEFESYTERVRREQMEEARLRLGDQINLAQVEKIAVKADGRFRCGFVDVEANPAVLEMYDNLEPPALMLFIDGERVFHVEGLFDAIEVYEEVIEILRKR